MLNIQYKYIIQQLTFNSAYILLNSVGKECRHAGWGCTDQKDPKKCKNEAVLQEIKIPIGFCASPILQQYKTICSKPKSQCGTQVRLPAIV